MKYGYRIIYDKLTGSVLNDSLDKQGDLQEWARSKEIAFLDLPYDYNENNFKNAIEYHINVEKVKENAEIKDIIVITKLVGNIETEEERLRRENRKLENQLLDTQEGIVNDKYNKLIQK